MYPIWFLPPSLTGGSAAPVIGYVPKYGDGDPRGREERRWAVSPALRGVSGQQEDGGSRVVTLTTPLFLGSQRRRCNWVRTPFAFFPPYDGGSATPVIGCVPNYGDGLSRVRGAAPPP